ncbi:hypothetical protein ENUP19_0248G0083 [Entamoeba nuttalli]|uniref:EhSec24B n=2 Tax=Entamoeba nuttalli TaxID=412467 RepID=A0ABQ0DR24_9EUKA
MFNPFEIVNGQYKGNCSKEFVTLTLNSIPNTREQLNELGLPFAICCHPMNCTSQPPKVSFPNGSINRCEYCRAFINPFVEWQVPGTRFVCNLCGHVNYLNKSPYQLYNINQYPELINGCVDFIVPEGFMPRIIDGSNIVLLIDLNCPVLEYVINCIESLEHNARVAVIAYDDTIHLFKATPTNVCENIIMPSMEVDICESTSIFMEKQKLNQVLELIKKITPNNKNCLLEALTIAGSLLKKIGGKAIVINSTPVTSGKGVYQPRNPIVEKRSNDIYKKLAIELNNDGITVDLHLVASSYVDLSQFVDISSKTGGNTTYNTLNTLNDGTFFTSLYQSFCDITGFDGSFRLRCSPQMRVVSRYGHFIMKISDIISSPISSSKTALTIRLTIDTPIVAPNIFIQSSYLYTAPDNTRCIRVCTIAIPVVSQIHQCLPKDFSPVCGFMGMILMDQRPELKINDLQNSLINQMAKVYKLFSTTSQQVQLYSSMVPQNLVPFTLYCCSILVMLNIPPSDYSIYLREKILGMKINSLQQMFFPMLYDAHSLQQIPTDTSNIDNLILAYNGEHWILSIGNKVEDQDILALVEQQPVCVITHSEGIFSSLRTLVGNAPIIVCKQGSETANNYLNNYLFGPFQLDSLVQSINNKMISK